MQPLEGPSTLTWTDKYKINGSSLRGIMNDPKGRNIYVSYQFKNEDEKDWYEENPLVGMQFEVEGELQEPELPAHQYAFNMKSYLKSIGAIGVLEIDEMYLKEIKSTLLQKISLYRFYLKQHIENTFPKSLFAEAQSLIIGLQENVDVDTQRAYQKLGITHLFAISGLHIAIVSFILFEGLLRLGVKRELAIVFLIVLLPVYAILAGGAPSVWRAVSVVELILITRFKWRLPIDDALAISFIAFVLLEPWSIYQIGFQLSYLASFSLIYSSHLLSRVKSWLMQSFLITFVCQLFVYPLLIFHFYEISLSSFFVNIVFVPLFSFIILPINIILLVISFLPGNFSEFLFTIYSPLRESLSNLIMWLQSLPYQMWITGRPSLFFIVIMYLSVFISFYLMDKKERLWKLIIILLIPVLLIQTVGSFSREMKISFVNVGQGDCILIELPYKEEVYLIDTGGVLRFEQEEWKKSDTPYEIGRQIVVPYLKGKGISHINKLILTHADSDHVEGAEELLKEFTVGEIHVSPNSYKAEALGEMLTEAKKRRIPIKEQMAGTKWQVGGITFHYLWPSDIEYEGNDDSLVLYVKNGSFRALFVGDLELEGETGVLQKYPQIQNIQLLKVGHHGSKTSSSQSFLSRLKPSLSIISAGKDNRYGHPHIEVMERFQSLGLKTLNTAVEGTIEITVGEDRLEVTSSNNYFN
ncbi:DNA internalization-related competence protein ComEC/Rec2 [Lysinibacillus sp. PLM2]|nr:DNA internalization-related competence protein ComEC/Rec2 [Lysinibacillus sp. PLM2]